MPRRAARGAGAQIVSRAAGVLGPAGAWGISRLLQSQLFGVTGTDSLTYLVSALLLLLLLAVALGACLASAWRGAGVNPTKALRTE